MSHRRDTTICLLAGLLIFGFSSGCGEGSTREESRSFEPSIAALDVRTGSGDIVVEQVADQTQIEIHARVHGSSTELSAQVVGDVLYLDQICPILSGSCAVDWHVRVPEAAASLDRVTLDTGSGNVLVRSLDTLLEVYTGSGDIELEAVHGSSFSFDTGSGDIDLAGSGADSLEGQTGSGNLSLDLDRRPQHVAFETSSGDIKLDLPSARYALDLDTESGDIDVRGIDSDNQAERRVELRTGSGNVSVHGH